MAVPTSLPGIRAIVFDAVGTLIHPEPPAPVVYAEVGQRFGSRLAPSAIALRFASAFRQQEDIDRELGLRTSEAREVQRWQQVVAQVLDDVTDWEGCFRELFEHFSRPQAWRCDPDAAATIAELANQGYVLGMASNYDRRLRSVAAGLAELEPLRHLVISSEVGWRKPAAEFFRAVCQAVAVPAGNVLYVGDDPVNDYEGARAAGLQAVLLEPQAKPVSAQVRRIRGLSEQLRVLGP